MLNGRKTELASTVTPWLIGNICLSTTWSRRTYPRMFINRGLLATGLLVIIWERYSLNLQLTWLTSLRSEAQARLFAGTRRPMVSVNTTLIMLQLFFVVECGIARFLCAVFKVRASSSSPRLPLCQIFFRRLHCWASPWRKSRTQSIIQLSLFDAQEPKRFRKIHTA